MSKATIIKEKFYVFKCGAKYLAKTSPYNDIGQYYLVDNLNNINGDIYNFKTYLHAKLALNHIMFNTPKYCTNKIRGLNFDIVEVKLTKMYIEGNYIKK